MHNKEVKELPVEPLGVAVIGCGNMGRDLAKGAATVQRIRVACVCDVDAEKGEALAKEVACDYVADVEAALGRGDVGAVVIATPPHLHEAPAVRAAEAGLHIFCEKPLAPSLEGCNAILAATRKADVVLAVGLVCRFLPVHKKVKELVAAGTVGDPICMSVHRLSGSARGKWKATWRDKREMSGGMLMETNAHEIDFIRHVMDDQVVEVYAAGGTYTHEHFNYPDAAVVTLRFKNGGVGSLHSSYSSAIGAYGGRLDGTKGSVAFPSIWASDAPIRYRSGDEEEVALSADDIKTPESGVSAELRLFAEAVQEGTPVGADGNDGRMATEIALAAYESIETGKPVRVGE